MGYEPIQTLATVRGLGRVGWDALGQSLLVEAFVGNPGEKLIPVPVSLTPQVAQELWSRLDEALAEREGEAPDRQ